MIGAFVLIAAVATAKPFTVVEASIPEMQAALKSGRITSVQLVQQYLDRIATYEDKLHAAITVNPKALEEAAELDRERKAGHIRGPLHGIPIALKDNILTTFMPTTGGALAFDGYVPPYDATVTKKLRDAGAIIIAKTQMTELANWVAGNPSMPNNYNAENGYGYNPYDPRRDPREATFDGRPAMNTGGSSSGAGTAANFWAANIGTETSGSILSPSNQNMLVGIKPTVGRISRYGIIPITADQDTAGPMAKSVTDAAIILGVVEGPDPNDAATTKCQPNGDYTKFLKADGLKGARIGIPRAGYYEKFKAPGSDRERGGLSDDLRKVMNDAIDVLKKEGAIIVDPADIPSVVDKDPNRNLFLWGTCTDMDEVKARKCSIDLAYGMERDFNAFLKSLGDKAPVKTLSDLRKWNREHEKAGAIKYGQSLLDISDAMDQ
ncbi:MAG TPA: amidase family protein, partial [Thermoanaerobaculia bacterium]